MTNESIQVSGGASLKTDGLTGLWAKNLNITSGTIEVNGVTHIANDLNITDNTMIKKIANKHSLSKISDEIENIEEAIKQYYDGQIDSALKIIRNIIREFKDVPYICTAFNHCGAFNNLATEKVADKDIDLYRARKGTADRGEAGLVRCTAQRR